ncbi:MAG: hypothetical protein ACC645_05205 [Pirellulales bacterium]
MRSVAAATTGSMRKRLARKFHLLRTRGAVRFGYTALRGIASLPLLRRSVRIYAGELLRLPLVDVSAVARTPRNFVVRLSDADDLPALVEYYGSEPLVRRRLDRGDLCVLTLCQDRIGAAVWLAVGPGDFREDWGEARYVCRFPTEVSWTYDGRGSKWGAWGTLMARLPDLMRQRGVHELVTLIDCNNWQSLDAHRSLGYETVGLIGCVGALGLIRSACKPLRRRWTFPPATIAGLEIGKRR